MMTDIGENLRWWDVPASDTCLIFSHGGWMVRSGQFRVPAARNFYFLVDHDKDLYGALKQTIGFKPGNTFHLEGGELCWDYTLQKGAGHHAPEGSRESYADITAIHNEAREKVANNPGRHYVNLCSIRNRKTRDTKRENTLSVVVNEIIIAKPRIVNFILAHCRGGVMEKRFLFRPRYPMPDPNVSGGDWIPYPE